MKMTLETDRLILRPFRAEDAEPLYNGWASDPEVTKYLSWNTHQSIDETKYVIDMWIKEYENPERINFAIELKEGSELIGGIDIVGYVDGIPEIGYNLARKHWNNGYMTEACRCVIDYLFSIGYDEVLIEAITGNKGSIKVIEKCGGVFLSTEEIFLKFKNKKDEVNRYVFKNPVKRNN